MMPIKNYEGLYSIDINGNIFSHRKGKYIKGFLKGLKEKDNQYITFKLCNNGKEKSVKLHRLLAELFIPNPENKKFVDHINRIKTDNRIENLRWVNQSENMQNVPKLQRNKTNKPSKYKGVSWSTRGNKWVAFISLNSKNKNLGYFDKQEDAAKAYNEEASKIYGKNAFVNII